MHRSVLRRLRPLATPANLVSAVLLLLILAALGWLRTVTDVDPFTAEGMSRLLDDLGWRGPLLYVLAVAIAVVVSQVPGVPLVVAAGAAFGIFPGLVYSVLGNFLGGVIAYLLGRSLGRGVMRVLAGRVVVFRHERGARAAAWLIFVSRALPLFPFDLISYAAGVSAVPLRAYAPATLFGLIPSTFLLTALGGSLQLGLGWSLAISAAASILLLALAWAARGRNPWGLRDAIGLERIDPEDPAPIGRDPRGRWRAEGPDSGDLDPP